MGSRSVVYCVDTNILIECLSLDGIPWRDLDVEISSVRIIIPTKVAEEIDAHKKSKNLRLRRRAVEFGDLARRVESVLGEHLVVKDSDPCVTVEFGPLFRRSDLDADQFELDDSDNRIVAEVAAIAKYVRGATLLTDDSKPIRLARQANLPHTRPLPNWRRQDGPDERDAEIADLKKELGARPELNLRFDAGAGNQRKLFLKAAPKETDLACSLAFRSAVLHVHPQIDRDQLIARHGYYKPDRSGFALDRYPGRGLTDNDLSFYDMKYGRFLKDLDNTSKKLGRVFSVLGISSPVTFFAGNSGERAADRVQVTAEISGPFHFMPTNMVARAIRSFINPPDPPSPAKGFSPIIPRNVGPPDRENRRPDVFYEQNQPDSDGNTKSLCWRCEELRQSEFHEIYMLLVADDGDSTGLLTVTMGSATIAKPSVVRVPLACAPAAAVADREFFLSNLIHIPRPYRSAFKANLGKL